MLGGVLGERSEPGGHHPRQWLAAGDQRLHPDLALGQQLHRRGEVLVADSERIEGWRNLGQAEAVLFWIVIPRTGRIR